MSKSNVWVSNNGKDMFAEPMTSKIKKKKKHKNQTTIVLKGFPI